MSILLSQVQQQDGESENSLFTNGWCHSGYIHPTVYDTRMKKSAAAILIKSHASPSYVNYYLY